MKKLMAIILTVTMLLSSLTVLTSFAEGETNALAEIITLPEGQTWTIEEGLKLGSVVYNDNSMTYWDFGGLALEGASYLQTTSAYAQTSHDNMCDSKEIAATVRVSKSCDVYVMTTCPYTNTQGMKDSNYMRWLLPDSIYSENSLKYGYEPVYDSEGNHVIVTTSSSRTLYVYKKSVIVPEGYTVDVNFGHPGRWMTPANMYTAAFVWKDTSVPVKLSTSSSNKWNLITPAVIGTSIYTDAEVKLVEYSVGTVHGANYYGLTGENTYLVQSANADATDTTCAQNNGSVSQWATITLTESAEVYLISQFEQEIGGDRWMAWLSNYGFERVYDGDEKAMLRAGSVNYNLYVKKVYVPEGQTVNVALGWIGLFTQQMYSAIVKITDVALEEKTAMLYNTNCINLSVKNGVSATGTYQLHTNDASRNIVLEDMNDVATIKASRYHGQQPQYKDVYSKYDNAHIDTLLVNNSCELYVVTQGDYTTEGHKWLKNDGYTLVGTKNIGTTTSVAYIYKKVFKIMDGETLEIPIGAVRASWYNDASYIVKWVNNRIDATLTLANTNKLDWEVVNNTSITGDGTAKAFKTEERYYTDIASYDFSDVSYIRSYSQYEPDAEYYKSLYAEKTYETIETMTVNNSCEVYIITKWGYHQNYFQWLANYGYELQADPVKIGTVDHKVYKRAFYLKDGETLEIPLGAPNSNMVNEGYNVIVKWIENPEVTPARVSFTTLGDNAEYYTVTENAYAGEYIEINGGRKIASFNNSGLEGAYILKPFAGDKTDNDFGYMQKPEDETLIKDTDFYTVTIDKTATVYVASPGKYISGSYMRWLADWQLVKDNEGNDVTITITNDDGSYSMEWVLYKKTFKVNNGETRTFALGNAVLYHNDMYATFFKFTDEDVYTVKLTVNGEGADIHPASDTDVLSGEALDFSFGITGDNYIKSIKFNGNEIYSDSDETVVWKTPAITSDATVEVTMDSDKNYPLPENISSVSKAFSAKGTEDLVVDYKVYKLNVIGFATAKAKIGPFARGEFGMLVATEKPESLDAITVENADVIKALADSSNDKGQYGIRLFGDSITSGQKCWMRAYAYYGDTVLYGTELIEAEF